jgi:hypothetical protein
MTDAELETITGMTGKTVWAKSALYQVLAMMEQRYGSETVDVAFAEVFAEIFGLELGDGSNEQTDD